MRTCIYVHCGRVSTSLMQTTETAAAPFTPYFLCTFDFSLIGTRIILAKYQEWSRASREPYRRFKTDFNTPSVFRIFRGRRKTIGGRDTDERQSHTSFSSLRDTKRSALLAKILSFTLTKSQFQFITSNGNLIGQGIQVDRLHIACANRDN